MMRRSTVDDVVNLSSAFMLSFVRALAIALVAVITMCDSAFDPEEAA